MNCKKVKGVRFRELADRGWRAFWARRGYTEPPPVSPHLIGSFSEGAPWKPFRINNQQKETQ
jgi:hypothetical protein